MNRNVFECIQSQGEHEEDFFFFYSIHLHLTAVADVDYPLSQSKVFSHSFSLIYKYEEMMMMMMKKEECFAREEERVIHKMYLHFTFKEYLNLVFFKTRVSLLLLLTELNAKANRQ